MSGIAANSHVVWSFGSGIAGQGPRELAGPHMAEENPFNPDEVLVVEENNCDVVIVNRGTRNAELVYGERGVAGSGERLHTPHSAHFIPSGPFRGKILITEYRGAQRVLIVDRQTREVLWSYADLEKPLDAIYWDEDHIMVSAVDTGIVKVNLKDKRRTWCYPDLDAPFYLQRLSSMEGASHGGSYGGDLLIACWGTLNVVREIRTSDKETIWEYGGGLAKHGNVYNKLCTSVCAFRYGLQEKHGDAVTLICEENGRRVFCVNRARELVWELGGASASRTWAPPPATAYMLFPTYVTATRQGTLLITEWGRNMIYEVDPFGIPPRSQKDAYLLCDAVTRGSYTDSDVMEARGFRDKNIQVINAHDAGNLAWRILASHNAADWQVVHTPAQPLAAGQCDHVVIDVPWNFIKAQVRSGAAERPARVDVLMSMLR